MIIFLVISSYCCVYATLDKVKDAAIFLPLRDMAIIFELIIIILKFAQLIFFIILYHKYRKFI